MGDTYYIMAVNNMKTLIRTTTSTYKPTIKHRGKTFHNIDSLGYVAHTLSDTNNMVAQLKQIGYEVITRKVGNTRYNVFTIPSLKRW